MNVRNSILWRRSSSERGRPRRPSAMAPCAGRLGRKGRDTSRAEMPTLKRWLSDERSVDYLKCGDHVGHIISTPSSNSSPRQLTYGALLVPYKYHFSGSKDIFFRRFAGRIPGLSAGSNWLDRSCHSIRRVSRRDISLRSGDDEWDHRFAGSSRCDLRCGPAWNRKGKFSFGARNWGGPGKFQCRLC